MNNFDGTLGDRFELAGIGSTISEPFFVSVRIHVFLLTLN
jgi:hypothetical protein